MRTSSPAQNDRFVSVNSDWNYAIKTDRQILSFIHQPDIDLWLAGTGETEIRLLPGILVINLLNEALQKGLEIKASNGEKSLIFS